MRLIRYLLLLSLLLMAACKPAPEAVVPAPAERTEAADDAMFDAWDAAGIFASAASKWF